MTTDTDTVTITFPRSCVRVEPDRVHIDLERQNIEPLMAYLFALGAGITSIDWLHGHGQG